MDRDRERQSVNSYRAYGIFKQKINTIGYECIFTYYEACTLKYNAA